MILFDTETTGLVKALGTPLNEQPEIIEFAAIKITDKKPYKEIERVETLIKPERLPLPDEIIKITGINDKMLEKQPAFAKVYPILSEFWIGERISIAHNHPFDQSLLTFALQRLGMETQFPYAPRQIDTAELSRKFEGYRLNLSKLYTKATGQDYKDKHRAMPDVEALLECVLWLLNKKHLVI